MKNKIDRGIEKYDCENLRTTLNHKYKHENASLRDLESLINTRFTAGALEQAGNPTDLRPETVYRTLQQSADTTDREHARLKTRLKQAGVPVDDLINDYISFRTVKNYLNDILGIDTSKKETITIDIARETISWSKSRCEGIIHTTLQRLNNSDLVLIPENAAITVNLEARVGIEYGNEDTPDENMSVTEYIYTYKQQND